MKKSIFIFGILALLLFGAVFASCKKDDTWEIPNGIKPVKPGKELTAFFDEKLGFIGRSIFGEDNDAILIGGGVYPDTCVMINSVDEFQAYDFTDHEDYGIMTFELPSIDFNAYTLVIGQYMAPTHGIDLVAQRIVVEPKEITMNILLRSTGITTADKWKKEYWGLYPKLPQLPISVVRQLK